MNLLQLSTVNISVGKIKIIKMLPALSENEECENEEPSCYLANINVDIEYDNYKDIEGIKKLGKEESEKIISIIKSYKPKESPIQLKIITVDDSPVYRPPRRFPPHELKIIEEQVNQWMREGIIRECASDYASQIVLVKKKDGSHRMALTIGE